MNTFFTCLTNGYTSQQSAVGSDFVSEDWHPRILNTAAAAIRRELFVDPERPEAVNWSAAALCKLVPKTDLKDMLDRFDGVTMYVVDDLQASMTARFVPAITPPGAIVGVRINPPLQTPAYCLHEILITVADGIWLVQVDNGPPQTGPVSSSFIEAVVIRGENTLLFSSKQEGQQRIVVASPGSKSLADISNSLLTTAKPFIAALAECSSVFDKYDRQLLVRAVSPNYEPGLVVSAASLLLAGYTATAAEA